MHHIKNSYFAGGKFTPVYASRRWAYLRGCYCKARNKLIKEKLLKEVKLQVVTI